MHRRPRGRRNGLLALLLSVVLVPVGFAALDGRASADAVNLVANPGFESGGLAGWTCDPGTATAVTAPVHSGTHALSALPTGSVTGRCAQTVAVRPNSAFTLSAWVQGSYVYLGTDGGASTWTPAANGWQQLSTTFTTGASTTSVTVYLHGWYGQGRTALTTSR
ncbi:carbohydrate binding domain-containing protein [Streptacidiphilus monticola]